MEDDQIVELYFSRDERAISESDQKYGRYLRTVSYRVLRNQEDTDECVNDTWSHAWNAIPPTRPDSLKAFLGRIARNLSLNRLEENSAKKRGNGEGMLVLDELEEVVSSGSSVEEEAAATLLRDTINSFLESLPKKNRIVFMQRYWHFCSVSEIAKKNGIGENTVKSILFRTRARLRECLEKEGMLS